MKTIHKSLVSLLVGVSLLFLLSFELLASSVMPPLPDLIRMNPLVVRGTITSITPATKEYKDYDLVVLRVDEVLKNNTEIKLVASAELSFYQFSRNAVHPSAARRFADKLEGYWILGFESTGVKYTFVKPIDYQGLDARSLIIDALKQPQK